MKSYNIAADSTIETPSKKRKLKEDQKSDVQKTKKLKVEREEVKEEESQEEVEDGRNVMDVFCINARPGCDSVF